MRLLALLLASTFTLTALGQPPAARESAEVAPISELTMRLAFVREASVQQELKLSDEQKEQIAKLPLLSRSAGGSGRNSMTATAASLWKQVASILKPEQATRLKQIVWQQSRTAGLANLLIVTEARGVIQLSGEQENQVRNVSRKLSGDRRALDRSDREAYATKSRELLAAADQQVEKLLSAEQNTKLKNEVLGVAFTGRLSRSWVSGFGDRGGGPPRTLSFRLGRGITAILLGTLLLSEPIQQELKLTDEQVKKASAQRGRGAPQNLDFLSAEQLQRLNQLAAQYAKQVYGPLGMMRYGQHVEALALSDDQKRAIEVLADEDRAAVTALGNSTDPEKIRAIDRQIDEKLTKILTQEQQEKVKQMLGPPFAGKIQLASRFGSGTSRESADRSFAVGEVTRNAWSYLRYPDVQQDIKLTAEQIKALPNPLGRGSVRDEQIRKVLSAEQMTRLLQIQLQLVQRRSGATYIFRFRDVAEAMKFTEEQLPKVVALGQATTRSGFSTATAPAVNPQDQQKIEEILTDEQESTLKGLLGPRFEGETPTPFGTRGGR